MSGVEDKARVEVLTRLRLWAKIKAGDMKGAYKIAKPALEEILENSEISEHSKGAWSRFSRALCARDIQGHGVNHSIKVDGPVNQESWIEQALSVVKERIRGSARALVPSAFAVALFLSPALSPTALASPSDSQLEAGDSKPFQEEVEEKKDFWDELSFIGILEKATGLTPQEMEEEARTKYDSLRNLSRDEVEVALTEWATPHGLISKLFGMTTEEFRAAAYDQWGKVMGSSGDVAEGIPQEEPSISNKLEGLTGVSVEEIPEKFKESMVRFKDLPDEEKRATFELLTLSGIAKLLSAKLQEGIEGVGSYFLTPEGSFNDLVAAETVAQGVRQELEDPQTAQVLADASSQKVEAKLEGKEVSQESKDILEMAIELNDPAKGLEAPIEMKKIGNKNKAPILIEGPEM